MRRIAMLPLILPALVACEGPQGPMGSQGPEGPQGEQGPQGPPGSSQRYIASGQLDSNGEAARALPAGVGSISDPPTISCYISDTESGPYLPVAAGGDGGIACEIEQQGDQLVMGIIGAPANWYFYMVAVF